MQATGRLICYQRLLEVSWGSNTVEVRLSWKDQTPRKGATVNGCNNKLFILVTRFLLIKLTHKAIQSKKVATLGHRVRHQSGSKRHFTVSFENYCHEKRWHFSGTAVMTTNRVPKEPIFRTTLLSQLLEKCLRPKILSPKKKKTQDEARSVDSCLEFLSRLRNSHNLGNIHWVACTSNRSFYSPHCFTPLRSACPRWLFIARLKLQTTPKVLRPKSNDELHMNLSRCTRVKFDRWEKRRT